MLKRYFKKAGIFTLCAIIFAAVAISLTGCSVKIPTVAELGAALGVPNLAEQAVITATDGKSIPYTDSDGYGEINVVFSNETYCNAVAIREKSSSVDDFEIRAKVNGEWVKLYRQDYIRSLRYCVFDDVSVTELNLRFKSSGEFTISELAVYRVPRSDKEFHVVSYLDVAKFVDLEEFDREWSIDGFRSVTDVILTGGAEFRSDGTLDVKEEYTAALSNLKTVETRLNKRFRVYSNLRPSTAEFALGNFGSESDQYLHAMKNNRDAFIRELNLFLFDTATDGVAFDWRYPEKNAEWNAYSEFLTKMKEKMESGRKLTVALAGWSCSLNRSAIDALDLVQVMSYDLPDNTGSHASFERALWDTEKLMRRGIPAAKLCMGIPFYARETDGETQRWFYYRDEAENLGRSYNEISNAIPLDNGEIYSGKRYYNGYLMVRDKTAYAYDTGLGGVMFWEHAADANYHLEVNGESVSLIRAISDAISMR